MNIALVVALLIGILSFVFTVFRDVGVSMIFNGDAFMIVMGGTTVAMFVGFPVRRIRDTVYDVIDTFTSQREREDIIRDVIALSRIYRKADIRGMEKRIEQIDDGFLKLGLNLLINNHESREIRNIMEREMMLRIINYNFSQNVLKTVARLTPSFGLAGTVISLIKMFKHLESADSIAPLMAVALMSTLYGVIIANLFMLPLCAKVKEQAIVAEATMNITIEGILLVKNRVHPLRIEDRLRGFQEADSSLPKVSTVPNASGVMYRFQKV